MASSSDHSDTKANLLGKRNPEDDLETKKILKKHKENFEEKIELLESDQEAYVRRIKRSVFVGNLSCDTEISDIIDFFKDVGRVVHVRLIVNHKRKHRGCGYVVFASSKIAKKALQNKNGEYLHDHKIFLGVTKKDPYIPRNKYCRYDKVQRRKPWTRKIVKNGERLCGCKNFLYMVEMAPYPIRPKYKDYLRRESVVSLLLEEVDDDDLEIKQNVKKLKVPKLPIFCGTKITFCVDD